MENTKVKFIPEFQTKDGIVTGSIVTDDMFENLVCRTEQKMSKRIVDSLNMHTEAMDIILGFVRESKLDNDIVKRAIELLNETKK